MSVLSVHQYTWHITYLTIFTALNVVSVVEILRDVLQACHRIVTFSFGVSLDTNTDAGTYERSDAVTFLTLLAPPNTIALQVYINYDSDDFDDSEDDYSLFHNIDWRIIDANLSNRNNLLHFQIIRVVPYFCTWNPDLKATVEAYLPQFTNTGYSYP